MRNFGLFKGLTRPAPPPERKPEPVKPAETTVPAPETYKVKTSPKELKRRYTAYLEKHNKLSEELRDEYPDDN